MRRVKRNAANAKPEKAWGYLFECGGISSFAEPTKHSLRESLGTKPVRVIIITEAAYKKMKKRHSK